ncbi:hypothetical protein BDQ17DRAFT_1367612 [Cyathus striatus]|nr:hypothetical protein BDQ17DRAFT_1367612 [Cyathus striatus]
MTGKFPHTKDENVPVDPSVNDTTHVPQPHNMAEPGVNQHSPATGDKAIHRASLLGPRK